MLLEPFIIDPADIGDGVDSSIVPVVLVVPTVPFVEVDVGQHIDELLLRVGDVPQQLVVEPQDAGPVFIGVALITLRCGQPIQTSQPSARSASRH